MGAGSVNMRGRDVIFNIKVGDRRVLLLNLKDSSAAAKDLSNTTTYATCTWKVWKPDGTLIINASGSFTNRSSGQVSYSLTAADTVIANAGNWEGEVEFFNSSSVLSDISETFNFNILESY